MTIFTDDCKKNYKEMPSGILLAESQNLIIPSGIVTMDMATDDEKALIFDDKILNKMPTSISGTYSALHTEVIHCSKK